MYEYRAKVVKIVDGDTVDFEVDLGFKIKVNIRTRLLEVNTPERGHPDWARATAKLTSLLESQTKDEYVLIKTEKTGKYGRWLVDIVGVNSELKKEWPYLT